MQPRCLATCEGNLIEMIIVVTLTLDKKPQDNLDRLITEQVNINRHDYDVVFDQIDRGVVSLDRYVLMYFIQIPTHVFMYVNVGGSAGTAYFEA